MPKWNRTCNSVSYIRDNIREKIEIGYISGTEMTSHKIKMYSLGMCTICCPADAWTELMLSDILSDYEYLGLKKGHFRFDP